MNAITPIDMRTQYKLMCGYPMFQRDLLRMFPEKLVSIVFVIQFVSDGELLVRYLRTKFKRSAE